MSEFEVRSLTFSTINSNNKNSTTPSYFLNAPITNINKFNVSAFVAVNNVYVIDSRNCNIRFQTSASTIYNAIIPTGNYTITTFLAALGTIMSAASGLTFTATNNTLTNIITITSSTLTFVLLPTINDCYYESGYTTLSSTLATSQTASSSFDLSGLKMMHVISSDLGNYCRCVN